MVSLGIVRLAQDIVDAYSIKIGKLYQNFICQLLYPGLNIAVLSLRDSYFVCNLLLRHVRVFAKIFDSVVHPGITTAYMLPRLYHR